jgi:hypothetical protein
MSRSPGDGCKFCDALEWCVCKSWKDVGDVITAREVEPAAAFNNGEDRRDAWAGVFAVDMDPVGPAQGDRTHDVTKGDLWFFPAGYPRQGRLYGHPCFSARIAGVSLTRLVSESNRQRSSFEGGVCCRSTRFSCHAAVCR